MRHTVYFLNRYYRPDTCATAQILGSLCDRLRTHPAFAVRVVCGRSGYVDPAIKHPAEQTLGGVLVKRLWSTAFGRRHPAGRLLDDASLHITMAAFLIRHVKSGDIVVVATDPPLLGVTVAWVRLVRPFTLVAWCQDIFPEIALATLERVSGGASRMGGFRATGKAMARAVLRALVPWRDWSLRQSGAVVAISPAMAHALQARLTGGRVQVIENWPVQEEAEAAVVARLRRDWRLEPGRLVVGHFGNLGRGHDYVTVWQAMETLTDAQVQWLFVGGGVGLEALRSRLTPLALGQACFAPYLPLHELGSGLSVPDLHWLTVRQVMQHHLFPSKFYGILKAGRPLLLIGDPESDLAQLIVERGMGIVIAEGDSDALVREMRRLVADRSGLEAMARRARAYYEERYSGSPQREAWGTLLQSLPLSQT